MILWDLGMMDILLKVRGHDVAVPWNTDDQPPVQTAFTADGRMGVSSAGDGALVIWDLVNAAEIRRFGSHKAEVASVAFTPDGKYVLTGSGRLTMSGGPAEDNTMKMWDVETGRLVQIFEGHSDTILAIAISPDGSRALTGGFDGTIKLWDLGTGTEIRSIDAHPSGVFAVGFSPDGQQAISGPMGFKSVLLWDLESGEKIHQFPFNPERNCTGVTFHPDGRTAYVDYSGLIVYDLENGQIIREYSMDCCTGMVIHPDWKSVFGIEGGSHITHWDLITDEVIRQFGDHDGTRSRLEISPDGNLLFSSEFNRRVVFVGSKYGKRDQALPE